MKFVWAVLGPVNDKLRAEGSDLEDLDAATKEQALHPHDASRLAGTPIDVGGKIDDRIHQRVGRAVGT